MHENNYIQAKKIYQFLSKHFELKKLVKKKSKIYIKIIIYIQSKNLQSQAVKRYFNENQPSTKYFPQAYF